jgi:TldD protein
MGSTLGAGGPRFPDWAPALAAGDHAEVYLEESFATTLCLEDSRITEASSGTDGGVGLRYLRERGGEVETLLGALNSLDPARAMPLARRLRSGLSPLRPPEAKPLDARVAVVRRHPRDVSMEEKAGLLARVDRAVREGFPHIVQVHLAYTERAKRFAVLNSDGDFRLDERIEEALVISITAGKDGLLQSSQESLAGAKGFEFFEECDPVRTARHAARNAVEKLSAPPAEAAEMPVVLAASAGGTLIHEAIGHSLEADHVQDGTSPQYAGRLGQTVAGEFLTIIDDPTLPYARGSYAFDDEGVPAAPVAVVRSGVLCDYLYDRVSARRDRRAPNGHGRRESFRHRPIPRMSNLYIAPGRDDPARIVGELDRGLLVTRMGGGEVNTATGEFVFGVDEGYWVDGGRPRHRLRDASILGVGPEVLRSIDRIGWDIGWGIGMCGKQGQSVPVSDGQPTLRIPKLLVGGRE